MLPDEELAIASITASVLVGVHRADSPRRRDARRAFVEAVFSLLPVIPFDLHVARTHAQLTANLQATRQSVGANDLLVAATAVAYDSPLVTENLKDFQRIEGLVVLSPGW